MAIWGWALLTTRPRLLEWHKVVMVQETEREAWARYLTACRLSIEAAEVPSADRPAGDRVCSICETTTD
jgi:hypothetical protein